MSSMPSWTPLWSTIVLSTLWSEPKEVRILFVTMLAMKDSNGVVHGTVDGLRRMSNLTEEETLSAVGILESPDERADSHQQFEGRRIERCEGGWLVLNHLKYRDMIQTIKRREYQRNWVAGKRKSKKTKAQVRAENAGREKRFVDAVNNGQEDKASDIAAENLPGV